MKNSDKASELPEAATCKKTKLKLTIQYAAHAGGIPGRPQFRKWVKAALMQDAEIVLRLVDETESRSLNLNFRGRDYATNVLTFDYGNTRPLSGDIVLCAPVVANEAKQQHKNLTAHYAHLTVHGVLHLQDYDHENDTAAADMERLETEIMMKLGHNDPYKECRPAFEET